MASFCSGPGTPNTPEVLNVPLTPEPETNIPPWTAYGSQGEAYFGMGPDILTVDSYQPQITCPWGSNTGNMCSSSAVSWAHDHGEVIEECCTVQKMQNLDYSGGGLMDWSGIENADLYNNPQDSQYPLFGTMVLEDVQPEIASRVMSVLIESKSPVKIRLCQ